MIKKLLLTSFVCSLYLSGTSAHFNGSYGGLVLSQTFVESRAKGETISHDTSPKKNTHAGFIIGHGQVLSQNIYFGMEGYINPFGLNGTPSNERFNGIKAQMTHQMPSHVVVRVGYIFGRVLPFVKAGGAYTRTTMQSDQKKDTIHSHGMVLGAGLDFDVAENIKVGISYTTTSYKSFIHNDVKITPCLRSVAVRLMYCF